MGAERGRDVVEQAEQAPAAAPAAVARLIQRQPKPGGGIDMKSGPGGLPWPSAKGKGLSSFPQSA